MASSSFSQANTTFFLTTTIPAYHQTLCPHCPNPLPYSQISPSVGALFDYYYQLSKQAAVLNMRMGIWGITY
uniref:Uncharacterized protein n=1 Tax=Moniliophthora roreri TaxID=221103 RepID=A0A0W0FP15_MONRR